jgi:hypothetical protein
VTKPPRTALSKPRYVERKPLKAGGWGYFFHVPSWARKAGCTVQSEPLGADYAAAVSRAETVLLPAFDAWRTGSTSISPTAPQATAAPGTLDWVFAEYRADRRYTKLDPKSKRNHEVGFKLVGGYKLRDGTRLGTRRLTAIDTALTDDLYEKLLIQKIADADGNVIERERRTTVNHAMKSCRRAWNICARRNPKKVVDGTMPLVNPFPKMGLESSDRETPDSDLSGVGRVPRQGGGVELIVASDRRADRLGMAAARDRYFRDLRRVALPAERLPQHGAGDR